jgi:hypothetical protein
MRARSSTLFTALMCPTNWKDWFTPRSTAGRTPTAGGGAGAAAGFGPSQADSTSRPRRMACAAPDFLRNTVVRPLARSTRSSHRAIGVLLRNFLVFSTSESSIFFGSTRIWPYISSIYRLKTPSFRAAHPHQGVHTGCFNALVSIGSFRKRLPVAAKIALVTAGAMAEVPGSPIPPGGSTLWTMWTSIAGASFMRSIW